MKNWIGAQKWVVNKREERRRKRRRREERWTKPGGTDKAETGNVHERLMKTCRLVRVPGIPFRPGLMQLTLTWLNDPTKTVHSFPPLPPTAPFCRFFNVYTDIYIVLEVLLVKLNWRLSTRRLAWYRSPRNFFYSFFPCFSLSLKLFSFFLGFWFFSFFFFWLTSKQLVYSFSSLFLYVFIFTIIFIIFSCLLGNLWEWVEGFYCWC